MAKLSPEKALSAEWLQQFKVRLITPKNQVFKVRILEALWNSLPVSESKTKKDELVAEVAEGVSVRSIQSYRKKKWKIKGNSRVKINEADWKKDFTVHYLGLDRKKKYTLDFSNDIANQTTPVTVEEKVKTISVDEVAKRKQELQKSLQSVEVESEEEREELSRNILLDYATGAISIDEACLRYNVRKDTFFQWIFQSPIIREMFSEATMILSTINHVEAKRRGFQLLLDKLHTGYTTRESYKFKYVANPDPESEESIPVLEGRIDERKEITISELTQLMKVLEESKDAKSVVPDEFQGWSDEELKKFIQKAESKLVSSE